jgi:hypothetical protein
MSEMRAAERLSFFFNSTLANPATFWQTPPEIPAA